MQNTIGALSRSVSDAAKQAAQQVARARVDRQDTPFPAAPDTLPGRESAAASGIGRLGIPETMADVETGGGTFGWLRTPTAAATPGASEATISTLPNGRILLDTGGGDDRVEITQDPTSGEVTVDVNGEQHTFTREEANILVVSSGDGDDFVNTDDGVTSNLSFDGGEGDDFIIGGAGHDRMEGGAGDDLLFGGEGRDYIHGASGEDFVRGEEGNDVLYGGNATDDMFGGAGDDYMDAGKGDDAVYGGTGDDVLSGGLGDDMLEGGDGGTVGSQSGSDVFYAGRGTDRVIGGSGDTAYVEAGDAIERGHLESGDLRAEEVTIDPAAGSSIVIDPSLPADARERIAADLETLRSSPTGRQMLEAIDQNARDTGNTVTITAWSDDNGTAAPDNMNDATLDPATGRPGPGSDVTISYNPQLNSMNFPLDATGNRHNAPVNDSADFRDVPPVVVLYHEMAHAYDEQLGRLDPGVYRGTQDAQGYDDTGMRNWERIAVGLPIDHDGDPATPQQVDPTHPEALTENALRGEMGIVDRTSYDVIRQGE